MERKEICLRAKKFEKDYKGNLLELSGDKLVVAIKEYEEKYNLHEPERCKSCNSIIEDKLESDFGYTYFEQTPSVY